MIAELIGADADHLKWWCPGCASVHVVPVNTQNGWEWNGSLEAPTLSPSILVQPHRTFINDDLQEPALTNEANITSTPMCHSYMRQGRMDFLSDCTHPLAGQTVDLPDIPERWRE